MGQNVVPVCRANASSPAAWWGTRSRAFPRRFRDAATRGLITFMGRFVTSPRVARTRDNSTRKVRRQASCVPEGRESPEKGTGVNYSAAPICGKEAGIIANSIISARPKESEVVQERETAVSLISVVHYRATILRASPRKSRYCDNDSWRIEGSSMLFSVNASRL